MIIKFLAVCRPPSETEEFHQELRDYLTAAFAEHFQSYGEDSLNLTTLDASEMLYLNLFRSIEKPGDAFAEKIIWGFVVEFGAEMENLAERERNNTLSYLESITKRFVDLTNESENIKHLVKFYDDVLLEQNLARMREVFALEMDLRQTLSLIYLSAFDDEQYYKLLRRDKIVAQKSLPTDENEMRAYGENEFYHLTFGQYPKLNNKKDLNAQKDLIELMLEANDFSELKAKLTNNPINDEYDSDLIAALREISPKIEEFRNCVAHNRKIDENLLRNYLEAKGLLTERLEIFFDRYYAYTC